MCELINRHYQLLHLNPLDKNLVSLLTIPQPPGIAVYNEGNGWRVLPNGTIWMVDIFKSLLKVDTNGHILDEFVLSNDQISDSQPLGEWIWIGSERNGL